MSAKVESVYLFNVYCANCGTGADEPYESEEGAYEWAETHDAENHETDNSNDEAYERFKEARDD